MYKVLIVDDEQIIRNGISTVIPWNDIGVSIVKTAGSGMDALKIIKKSLPDILITDINMTEMSGLETIEKARLIHPDIRIIVITGYNLFDYAHKSIQMHVDSFFLKPVDEDELTLAVIQIITKLKEIHQQKLHHRAQGLASHLFLERTMRNLIYGNSNSNELNELEKTFAINLEQPLYIAILNPDLGKINRSFALLSIKNICVDLLDSQNNGITFQDRNGKILLLIFENSEKESGKDCIREISEILLDETGEKPRIVLGKTVSGFKHLSKSYQDAISLLEKEEKNLQENSLVCETNHLHGFYESFYKIKESIFSDTGNTSHILELFSNFEKSILFHNISPPLTRKFCFDFASSVCYAHALDTGEIVEGKLQALINALEKTSRKEALEYTKNIISQILRISDENMHSLVAEAKSIINKNLSDSISVLSIASELFISPNYLSRLFKKVVGEGCNEYVVRKRIEKARHLLEVSTMNSGKIAGMVGYQDINYFSIAFKKHTGMSPTKYRESIKNRPLT